MLALTEMVMKRSLYLAALVAVVSAEIFDVTKYGAKGDGKTRNDGAIEAVFAACASSSAGEPREVLFPSPGQYVTGPWKLACNDSVVTVESGASIVSFTANGSTQGWPLGPMTSPGASKMRLVFAIPY